MDNNGLVLQSSIGGRLVDSKLVAKTNQLSFARVKSVNYQKNTVVFVLITDTGSGETTQGVTQEAMLPMVSAGRNGFGHAYGEIAPIHPGDIVLLGFVGENTNNPIVIARYGDSTIAKEVANQTSPDYSPTDFSSYAKANQGIIVYPDMTYNLHDGRGNLALTFSGGSFLLVRPDTPLYSAINDDTDSPLKANSLPGAVDGNGDPRYPLVQNAPQILFNHSGNIKDDGNKDNHEVYFYIGKDGHFRLSSMQDDQDWRTYFEETPDGQIRLRRQEDSKIFGSGSKSSEISIDSNGYVNIRSQNTGLVLRPDGIYNLDGTKFTADTDLSEVWSSIQETQDGVKKNSAQITANSEEIATKVSTDTLPSIIDDQMKPYTDNLKNLNDSYTDMQKTLDNMASDGVISSTDKKAVRTIWLQIQTEYPSIVAQAIANKVDHSSLDGAYTNLKSYIEPILAASGDTTVDPTEWDRNFSNYYNSAYNTNTAIVAALQDLAQSGYDTAVAAAGSANNAFSLANQATDANYLTGSDKASLNRNWIQIQNNYPNDVSSADAVSISHASLDTAYNNLKSYIDTSKIFDDSSTTQIDATQLATNIKAYYDAEAALMKQVADKNIATLEQYGQDIDHQATSIEETSSKIALSAENIQKHDDKLSAMQGQLSVMANEISAGLSETDVTGLVNNSLAGNEVGSMNQFVVSTATKGQYMNGNNGSTSSSSNGIISANIQVVSGKQYSAEVYGVTTSTKLSVAWFDSSNNFISGTEVSSSSNVVNSGTAPSNASYAKVSTDDNTKNVLFILGNAPDNWSPSYLDAKGNLDSCNQILKSLQDYQSSIAKLINGNTNKNNVNTSNINSMFSGGTLATSDIGILNAILSDTNSDNASDNSLATQFGVDPSALNNLYNQLNSEISSITSQAVGSTVDVDTYKAKLTGYYTGRDTFLKAVKAKADSQVSSAQDAVNDASNQVSQIITNKYDNFSLTVSGLSNTVGETQTIANNAQATANSATSAASAAQTAADKAQGDVNNLSTTTTNKFSQIQQTTDKISTDVQSVTTTANNASDKINNLQVGGTNLITGTSSQAQKYTIDKNNWTAPVNTFLPVTTGQVYTYRLYIESNNTEWLEASVDGFQGSTWKSTWTGNIIKTGSSGYSYVTVTIPDGITQIHATGARLITRRPDTTVDVYWQEEKLEVGNTATAWSPAPADNASASDLANFQQTTTQRFSKIDQTTDSITQTVANVTTTANNASNRINNLQVGGTNMITGTSNQLAVTTLYGWGEHVFGNVVPQAGTNYCFRVWIDNPTFDACAKLDCSDSSGSQIVWAQGNTISAGTSGYSIVKVTTDSNYANIKCQTVYTFNHGTSVSGSYGYKEAKLEVGNVPTAWSPAPADNASASDLATTNQTVKTVQTQTANNWSIFAQGIGGTAAGISVDGNGTVTISGDKLVIGSDFIAGNITGKTITGSKFLNNFSGVQVDNPNIIRLNQIVNSDQDIVVGSATGQAFKIIPTQLSTIVGSYTFSSQITNTNAGQTAVSLAMCDPNNANNNSGPVDVPIVNGTVTHTFTGVSNPSYTAVLAYPNSGGWAGSANKVATYHHYKLQYGTTATPWITPGSENILLASGQTEMAGDFIQSSGSISDSNGNDTGVTFWANMTPLGFDNAFRMPDNQGNFYETQIKNGILNLFQNVGDPMAPVGQKKYVSSSFRATDAVTYHWNNTTAYSNADIQWAYIYYARRGDICTTAFDILVKGNQGWLDLVQPRAGYKPYLAQATGATLFSTSYVGETCALYYVAGGYWRFIPSTNQGEYRGSVSYITEDDYPTGDDYY